MVPGVQTFFQACVAAGIPVCLDNNSGNPVGVGLAQFNVRDGERSYAANAFLSDDTRSNLANLVVVTDTECDRVVIQDKKVVGVELFDKVHGNSGALDVLFFSYFSLPFGLLLICYDSTLYF
jgi:choline dehydrogenase-like flavoprotein